MNDKTKLFYDGESIIDGHGGLLYDSENLEDLSIPARHRLAEIHNEQPGLDWVGASRILAREGLYGLVVRDRKQVKDLQIGDTVVISTGYRGEPYQFSQVKKITATQITLTDGDRYYKRSLVRVGEAVRGSGKRRIVESWLPGDPGLLTVEEAEQHNRKIEEESVIRQLAARIADVHHLKGLSRERLEQIVSLIWPETKDGE